jgi:hypothetical protein
MDVQTVLPYFQLMVSCGTFLGMLFALKKFIDKPHDDLEHRVSMLEAKVKEHDNSLNNSHEKLRDEKRTDSLIINSLIALIEFETDYCLKHGDETISPGLLEAKKKLYEFLAEK